MDYLSIIVRGLNVKFYPKTNINGHYFEMNNGHGFYDKDFLKVYGVVNKDNCTEICKNFVESNESRTKTFDSYKIFQNETANI